MRWTLQTWMRDTTLDEFFGTELEPDDGVPVTSTIQRLCACAWSARCSAWTMPGEPVDPGA
jgi:hypothetical protein